MTDEMMPLKGTLAEHLVESIHAINVGMVEAYKQGIEFGSRQIQTSKESTDNVQPITNQEPLYKKGYTIGYKAGHNMGRSVGQKEVTEAMTKFNSMVEELMEASRYAIAYIDDIEKLDWKDPGPKPDSKALRAQLDEKIGQLHEVMSSF